jgi:hypothetical protein
MCMVLIGLLDGCQLMTSGLQVGYPVVQWFIDGLQMVFDGLSDSGQTVPTGLLDVCQLMTNVLRDG